ncbi:MAG: hypothetical protein N2C14_31225, partial [Planctomycetales bacterium]
MVLVSLATLRSLAAFRGTGLSWVIFRIVCFAVFVVAMGFVVALAVIPVGFGVFVLFIVVIPMTFGDHGGGP